MRDAVGSAAPRGHVVGLVADDVTGANDSAVQFARRGWRTMLAFAELDPPFGSSDVLLAISTDSRAVRQQEAQAASRAAVDHMVGVGADRLFLKIDSTLRGPVQHQVSGARMAWSATHPGAMVVVCPAYPAMGRVVQGGRALVDGTPVHDTAAGEDPITPVTTSRLAELLPRSKHLGHPDGEVEQLAQRIQSHEGRTITLDAVSDEDLYNLALAVALVGPACVVAGSAGLATAMARTWASGAEHWWVEASEDVRPSPTVVLVSSVHPVARAQTEVLRNRWGTRLLEVSPRLRADDPSWSAGVVGPARWGGAVGVVLHAAPMPEPGAAGTLDPGEVAHRLARAAVASLERHAADAVVVTGGDGARALADELGAAGIEIESAVAEGTPVGRLIGGRRPGMRIITKAGGFGGPNALVDAVVHVSGAPAPAE